MNQTEDQLDSGGGITDLVFDAEHQNRQSWRFCNLRLARSEVVYFTQIFIIIFLITVSLIKLVFLNLIAKNQLFGILYSRAQLGTLFLILCYEQNNFNL